MSVIARRVQRRGDDGFTVIIFAIVLIMLMVFAAFATDLGLVFSERRLDQNAADAAATGGAVVFLKDADLQSAVNEVLAKVNADLGRTVSASPQWTGCADPAKPAEYVFTASSLGLNPRTVCISFNGSFDKMRVKLPDQTIDSVFGQVVGLSSYTSSAFAEVNLNQRGGGAMPFVVLDGVAQGQAICLRVDNSGGTEPPQIFNPYSNAFEKDPCDTTNYARAEGSRGTIKPYYYKPTCDKPSGNQSIVDAIRVGMDHPLGVFDPPINMNSPPGQDANQYDPPYPGARLDGGPSNNCRNPFPNTVDVDTGFTAQLLRCALLENPCNSGATGGPGRLTTASADATMTGLNVDDNALWSYMIASPPGTSCQDAKNLSTTGATFYTKRAALLDCLQNWTPGDGQLFTEAVGNAKRLGFVPKIAELGLCRIQPNPPPPLGGCGGGSPPDNVHINYFAPVYIDGLYNDNGGICDTDNPATPAASTNWSIHYPGKLGGLNCNGGQRIERLSGIVVPCGALPPSVCDPSSNPPFPSQLGINRVVLTR